MRRTGNGEIDSSKTPTAGTLGAPWRARPRKLADTHAVRGRSVGAAPIGVSGVKSSEDGQIAEAGARAL